MKDSDALEGSWNELKRIIFAADSQAREAAYCKAFVAPLE